jgi:hypothetical protein
MEIIRKPKIKTEGLSQEEVMKRMLPYSKSELESIIEKIESAREKYLEDIDNSIAQLRKQLELFE